MADKFLTPFAQRVSEHTLVIMETPPMYGIYERESKANGRIKDVRGRSGAMSMNNGDTLILDDLNDTVLNGDVEWSGCPHDVALHANFS